MKIAIMQPYIFPYIGYYQLIQSVDNFYAYDDVTFIKKGWINRNKIIVNSKEHLFTIPLKNVSRNRKINEHYVAEDYDKWKLIFLKTIYTSYNKSKYFNEINTIIETTLSSGNNISDISIASLQNVCYYLNIETNINKSSNINNIKSSKGQRLIDICKAIGSDTYVNSIGGQILYSKDQFKNENIDLYFLNCKKPMNYMSIIDVLMNNGKDTINLLNEYELI
jgi:hypothetical protein